MNGENMKVQVIDITRVECEYKDKCKDYKVRQYTGQSPSMCKRCRNNKYAEKPKKPKKSYFKSVNDENSFIKWFVFLVIVFASIISIFLLIILSFL